MNDSRSDIQIYQRMSDESNSEDKFFNRKRDIERKLKFYKDQYAVTADVSKESQRIKNEASSQMNKFVNDGSFMEQFRKATSSGSITDTSSNSCIPSEAKIRDTHKEQEDERGYLLKETCYSASEEKGLKKEPKTEDDPSASDWFQDALKRAREKAKELIPNSATEVSLSANSICESEDGDMKKKRSRWGGSAAVIPPPAAVVQGPSQQTNFSVPGQIMNMVGQGQHMEAIQGVMITRLTRNSPAIVAYASKVFGTLDLTDAQWKQCEEQMKMNIVFQLLGAKKKETERLEQQGRVKYEYDSDEEIDGGTWEHKRRKKEMEETAIRSGELTREAEGKHHIGDFLPPEELTAFIEKYQALKEGRDPDMSDYRENRITEDNIGYKMLKSMGWTEGTGLGAEGKGITAPVRQNATGENKGLGVSAPHSLSVDDDEYDAYRKRMMLAYRFRPNPLNNPRRAYY